MKKNKRNILTAHILLSLLVFITLFAVIKIYWFPGKLIEIDGGWKVIKIIAGVDIVLGPLLTLFFIHPERKSFKKDFAFIISVQFVALFAGIYTVIDQRVSVIVFSENKFYSISHGTLTDAKNTLKSMGKSIAKYKSDHHSKLKIAYVKPIGVAKNLENVLNGYPELPVRPDLFRSINKQNWKAIQKHKITNIKIINHLKSIALMDGTELLSHNLEWYNLKGRYKNAYMMFDSNTFKLLKILLADTSKIPVAFKQKSNNFILSTY